MLLVVLTVSCSQSRSELGFPMPWSKKLSLSSICGLGRFMPMFMECPPVGSVCPGLPDIGSVCLRRSVFVSVLALFLSGCGAPFVLTTAVSAMVTMVPFRGSVVRSEKYRSRTGHVAFPRPCEGCVCAIILVVPTPAHVLLYTNGGGFVWVRSVLSHSWWRHLVVFHTCALTLSVEASCGRVVCLSPLT